MNGQMTFLKFQQNRLNTIASLPFPQSGARNSYSMNRRRFSMRQTISFSSKSLIRRFTPIVRVSMLLHGPSQAKEASRPRETTQKVMCSAIVFSSGEARCLLGRIEDVGFLTVGLPNSGSVDYCGGDC
jgi:hypothetical protein